VEVSTIAFFDLDGTLIRRDSGVICAVPSMRRGLLGPRIFAELVATWLLSKAGLRTRTDAMRVGFRCYAGRSLEELRALTRMLYDEHLRHFLSEPMLDRVRHHKRAGDRLVILTASAFFVAEALALDLGFDELHGTQVRFVDGVCTGVVDGEILDGKAKLGAARRVADARGVDLGRCSFYSDHIADLPLLEAVESPVVVGGSRALGRVARARGWPVVPHDAAAPRELGATS
jgi:HAD superfamily hydrolase (TIGR01490 family)